MVKKKITKKTHKSNKTTKQKPTDTNIDLKKFVFEKKGFVIAMIILLIAILLLFLGPTPVGLDEEYAYTLAYYNQNNEYFDGINSQIDIEIQGELETDLDKEYYLSIKEDMSWLKTKNTAIFYSGGKIFVKGIAFMLFMEEIISLNEDFITEIGTPSYDSVINLAKEKEYSMIFFPSEISESLESADQVIFDNTLNQLSKEYFEYKLDLINNSYQKRSYVEAKKIIYLYE
jgi:hypothetical protein